MLIDKTITVIATNHRAGVMIPLFLLMTSELLIVRHLSNPGRQFKYPLGHITHPEKNKPNPLRQQIIQIGV